MRNKELFYHWYEEPDHCIIKIDKKKLKELVPTSQKFSFLNYRKSAARVVSLKKFCNLTDISYEQLENKGIISINDKIKFPIYLNLPEFATIIAAAINEGHLKTGKYLFEYYNKDLILHKIVKNCAFKLFGKEMRKPEVKGRVLRSYSYGIIARALHKVGVIIGDKSLANGSLPLIIKTNPELWKYYFS